MCAPVAGLLTGTRFRDVTYVVLFACFLALLWRVSSAAEDATIYNPYEALNLDVVR